MTASGPGKASASRRSLRAVDRDDDEQDDFAGVKDTDELCQRLLGPAGQGFGSGHHQEVVEVLARVRDPGDLTAFFAALLICTSTRWDRVTGRLIAALETGGVLRDEELDELANALVVDALVVEFPATWLSPEWLEIDSSRPQSARRVPADERTPITLARRIAPPLRRWSTRRVLMTDPGRYAELLDLADRLDLDGRAGLLLGLLDARYSLATDDRRQLMQRALATGIARVRRAALDLMTELDGADAALARARSDRDTTVRGWRPPELTLSDSLTLL